MISVADELAIQRLIITYASLLDQGRWADVAALYTEDGRMSRPTAPDDFVSGRAAIFDGFLSRPARISRHICCNILVELTGADVAEANSQILLFTGSAAEDGGIPVQSPAPPMVGSYRDKLIRTSEGWRFAERRGSLDFRAHPG
jgi:hypothetical protein